MSVFEANGLTVSGHGTLPRVPFLALKEKILGKNYTLSIAFVSSNTAAQLNKEKRGGDYIPNTLSFSLSKDSGEIVLCRSAIRAQHKKFAMAYDTYVMYLIIHSSLHLKGLTHGSTMENKEKRLLAFFTQKHSSTHEAKLHRRH